MDFKPCVVIPFFNHAFSIKGMLLDLEQFNLPCFIIDDGSQSSCADVLREISVIFPWVEILHNNKNLGKGFSVCKALQYSYELGYSHAIQIDADRQHRVEDIPVFLKAAKNTPKALILGNPIFNESISRGRLYGRFITHFWVWVETLSTQIKDTMCGFRVYPLDSVANLISCQRLGHRMDFDIEVVVRLFWRGLRIQHIPTKVDYPSSGVSHFQLLWDNIRISMMHTKLCFGMIPRIPRLLKLNYLRSKNITEDHWFSIQERGAIWGVKIMLLIYRILGRRICTWLLFPVVGYFYLTDGPSRKASQQYLKRLYAAPKGRSAITKEPSQIDSFRHFLEFGRASVDKFSSWMGDIKRHHIKGESRSILLELVRKKQGAVFIGSHLGNIEILRALIDVVPEMKVHALIYMKNARQYNELLKSTNPRMDLQVIHTESISVDTSIHLKERVEKGEFISLLGDRVTEGARSRSSTVSFLGHPASFPHGPFILSSLMDCPVFLIFCLRQGMWEYNIHIEKFEEKIVLPRKERSERLDQCITKYVQRLEEYCYMAPYQWFNFYDFWQVR